MINLIGLISKKPVFFAATYLFVLIAPAHYMGAMNHDNSDFAIRMQNAAIGMPLLTVASLFGSIFIVYQTLVCIKKLANSKPSLQSHLENIRHLFLSRVNSFVFPCGLLGIIWTWVYNYFEGTLIFEWNGVQSYLLLTAPLFWWASFFLVGLLILITRHVIGDLLKKHSLDLFSIEQLLPVSDLVIYNIIVMASLFALSPIFWLGKSVPVFDLVFLFIIFIVLSYFLFTPVVNVHLALCKKKKQAIERINGAIRRLMIEKGFNRHTQFFERPEELRMLAALVSTKNQIAEATEWPIDVPQSIKGVLVCISIPASWAIGSLVDKWLSTAEMFA